MFAFHFFLSRFWAWESVWLSDVQNVVLYSTCPLCSESTFLPLSACRNACWAAYSLHMFWFLSGASHTQEEGVTQNPSRTQSVSVRLQCLYSSHTRFFQSCGLRTKKISQKVVTSLERRKQRTIGFVYVWFKRGGWYSFNSSLVLQKSL